VLLVGANGQLGSACASLLSGRAVALGHRQLDIADRRAVEDAFRRYRPTQVINCAAATDVDRCEKDHEYADRANRQGPLLLARLAAASGATLVHISTDYVFDGQKPAPYVEEDLPRPLNYYGLSKLRGEEAVLSACASALVVRTSWVFGRSAGSFPHKVLSWAGSASAIRVAADQRGSPTYAPDLAVALLRLLEQGATGIYHLAGRGCASRLELAEEVLRAAGIPTLVQPAASSEFPSPAVRPRQTCLDCGKAAGLGVRLAPWREAVVRFLGNGYCASTKNGRSAPGRPAKTTESEG